MSRLNLALYKIQSERLRRLLAEEETADADRKLVIARNVNFLMVRLALAVPLLIQEIETLENSEYPLS